MACSSSSGLTNSAGGPPLPSPQLQRRTSLRKSVLQHRLLPQQISKIEAELRAATDQKELLRQRSLILWQAAVAEDTSKEDIADLPAEEDPLTISLRERAALDKRIAELEERLEALQAQLRSSNTTLTNTQVSEYQ